MSDMSVLRKVLVKNLKKNLSPLGMLRIQKKSAQSTGFKLAVGALGVAGAGLAIWAATGPARRAAARDKYLRGRVVAITGGSRGLGLLMAREYARAGAFVAICARDEEELQRAQLEFDEAGLPLFAAVCNVADRVDLRQWMTDVLDRFGGIDVLVNNAGIIGVGPFKSMGFEDFDQLMAVNFGGALNATLEALPYLTRRGEGRIVNISSIGGSVPIPHLLPYTASKFALSGFSLGLRQELLSEGIRVTTVVPGLMRTGSHLNAQFKGKRDEEYAWFAWGASSPLTSVSGESAARQIVDASVSGQAWLTISWPARLLRNFSLIAPGLSTRFFSMVNDFMPKSPGPWARDEDPEAGWRHRSLISSDSVLFGTALGDEAARKNNETA